MNYTQNIYLKNPFCFKYISGSNGITWVRDTPW